MPRVHRYAGSGQTIFEEGGGNHFGVMKTSNFFSSLKQGFPRYDIKEEILEGENQYHSDKYGKQDAKKGVLFKSLPPVLEVTAVVLAFHVVFAVIVFRALPNESRAKRRLPRGHPARHTRRAQDAPR